MSSLLRTTACLAIALLMASSSHAEQLRLRLGSDGAYPPHGYKDTSGQLVGFEVDLAKDLCRRINADCEWVIMDFDGLIPSLQAGRIDVIMAALSITDERDKSIDFSVPYTSGPEHFFASAEFAKAHQIASDGIIDMSQLKKGDEAAMEVMRTHLKGKSIGVLRGSTMESFIRTAFKDAEIRVYDKDINTLLDLASGRIDIAMCDGEVGAKFIKEEADSGHSYAQYGPGFRGGLLGKGVALGLADGANSELRDALNKAIIEATKDGTIPKLAVQWLGEDTSISLARLEREAAAP